MTMQNFSMPHLLWHKVLDIHNCCRVFGSRILFNDLHVHVGIVHVSRPSTYMYEAKALTNCATSAALVLFCVPLKTLKIFINIRITSVGEGLPNLDLYLLRRLNGLFDKAGISMILMEKYSWYILNSRYNIIIYTLHRCKNNHFEVYVTYFLIL